MSDKDETPKETPQPQPEKKVADVGDILKIRNWEIIDTNTTALIKKSKDVGSSNRENKDTNDD